MSDFGSKRPMSDDAPCVSEGIEKAKRGRPKKKSDYDRDKEIEAFQARTVELFGEPYRKALFKLVQEPEEWKHRSSKKKLERFFHSKWYRTLTDLDSAILMQEAKRQADINVERWERGRAKARERAERKAAKKNLSAAAVM